MDRRDATPEAADRTLAGLRAMDATSHGPLIGLADGRHRPLPWQCAAAPGRVWREGGHRHLPPRRGLSFLPSTCAFTDAYNSILSGLDGACMESLEAWLRANGLAEHVPAFRAHRVALAQLADLTDEDLRELGLVIGDRKRLRAALAQHDIRPPPDAPAPSGDAAHPLLALPERRPLTVAFIDLVESTSLAARLEPEDLLETLRRYREACTGAILRYGGHVAQFLGDGILAYFCYPVAHEDDPDRAVLAGLEAISAVRLLLVPGGGTLDARAGIATGRVVIGDLFGAGSGGGTEARSALGSAPNLAARLQAMAPPGGVVVSAETAAKLGGRFALTDLGPHALKGFADPQRAFRVLGERRRSLRPRRRGGESPPSDFVNRESQLALLHATWSGVLAGNGVAVLLRGEAGIGKSRLVQRFLVTRRAQGISTAASIFGSPFHGDSPLHPVAETLRALTRISPDDTVPDALRRLRRLLPAQDGGGQPEELVQLAALAELLGLPGADEPLRGLAPQRLKALLLDTLAGMATRLAAARPLCLVVEDAHWLDPTSRELLGRLLAGVPGRRMLLLVTAREGFAPPEGAGTGLVTLDLKGLAEADAERLLQMLCGEGTLPAPLREDLIRRTMGVPFFVEEFAHTLAGRQGGAATATGAAEDGTVPVSLQECLAARLDRAGPAKAVAQVAAVLGAPLRPDLLAAVAGLPVAEMREALARLDAAGVLRRDGGAEGETWAFRHALLRDAAYDSLLRDRRRALHGRAADALAALPPEEAAPAAAAPPEILAHHLCEAGRAAESLPHWLAAARRSLARSALAEATRLLRRGLAALDALPDGPETRERRLGFMALLGPALIGLRGPGSPEAQALYAEAVELCRGQQPQRPEHFPIYWGWWRLSLDYRDYRSRAAALFTEARSRRDRDLLLQAHHCNWAVHFHTGDLCGCERHIRAGLRLYSEAAHAGHASLYGNHDARVCGLAERSLSLWQRGRPLQAAAEARRAGDWARHLRHIGSIVHAQDFATMLAVYRRDPAAVAAEADRLAALAEEHGFDDHRARCLVFRGWAMAVAGEAEAGAAMAEEGLAIEREINTAEDFPIFHCLLAEAQAAAGDPERALAELTAARDEFRRIGLTVWMPEIWRTTGDLALRLDPGAAEAAAAAYDEAARLAEAQGADRLALRALLGRARLAPRLGGQAALAARLAAARARIVEADEGADLREAAELAARLAAANDAAPPAVGCAG